MRMLLLESTPNISKREIQVWEDADDETRSNMIDVIINRYKNSEKINLKVIKDAIYNNCVQNGINPLTNDFMTLLGKIDFPLERIHNVLFNRLSELHNKENIDLTKDYLINDSLYNRSQKAFDYTVRLFDTVSTPSKLKRFFKDIDNIKITDLYKDDGATIKPVGSNGPNKHSTDTLYGTVEMWSGENGKNDVTDDYVKSKVLSKTDNDNDNPISNKVKMNITSLKALKVKYKNMTIDQIEKQEPEVKQDGTIIYARGLKHKSDGIDADKDFTANGFYIYNNGKWSKYENDITRKVL